MVMGDEKNNALKVDLQAAKEIAYNLSLRGASAVSYPDRGSLRVRGGNAPLRRAVRWRTLRCIYLLRPR